MTSSPVLVVHVLAYERVGLHRAVGVHLRHVHVVYEVDEPPAARGAVVAAGFLLQGFFQHRCVGGEPRSRVQGSEKNQKTKAKTLRRFQCVSGEKGVNLGTLGVRSKAV